MIIIEIFRRYATEKKPKDFSYILNFNIIY